jgi:hypothetical protein
VVLVLVVAVAAERIAVTAGLAVSLVGLGAQDLSEAVEVVPIMTIPYTLGQPYLVLVEQEFTLVERLQLQRVLA